MLSREKFEEISKALENPTVSSRSVARAFGVSHTLALKIRRGRQKVRIFETPSIAEPTGEYRRCPKCGAKSKSPCVYCAVRARLRALAHNASEQKYPVNDVDAETDSEQNLLFDEAFELELEPQERARYLEVRRWRERRANPFFDVVPDDWPWLEETIANSDVEQSSVFC